MTNKLKNREKRPYNNDLGTRGWPPERRRAQAERLRRAKIWKKSTGPRTKSERKLFHKMLIKTDTDPAKSENFAVFSANSANLSAISMNLF